MPREGMAYLHKGGISCPYSKYNRKVLVFQPLLTDTLVPNLS